MAVNQKVMKKALEVTWVILTNEPGNDCAGAICIHSDGLLVTVDRILEDIKDLSVILCRRSSDNEPKKARIKQRLPKLGLVYLQVLEVCGLPAAELDTNESLSLPDAESVFCVEHSNTCFNFLSAMVCNPHSLNHQPCTIDSVLEEDRVRYVGWPRSIEYDIPLVQVRVPDFALWSSYGCPVFRTSNGLFVGILLFTSAHFSYLIPSNILHRASTSGHRLGLDRRCPNAPQGSVSKNMFEFGASSFEPSKKKAKK